MPKFIKINFRNDRADPLFLKESDSQVILLSRLYKNVLAEVQKQHGQPVDLAPFFAEAVIYVAQFLYNSSWVFPSISGKTTSMAEAYGKAIIWYEMQYKLTTWFLPDSVKFLYQYGIHDKASLQWLCHVAIEHDLSVAPYLTGDEKIDLSLKTDFLGKSYTVLSHAIEKAQRPRTKNTELLLKHGAIPSIDDIRDAILMADDDLFTYGLQPFNVLLKHRQSFPVDCLSYLPRRSLSDSEDLKRLKLILNKIPLNEIGQNGKTSLRMLLEIMPLHFRWGYDYHLADVIQELLEKPIIISAHTYQGETIAECAERVIKELRASYPWRYSDNEKANDKKLNSILQKIRELTLAQQQHVNADAVSSQSDTIHNRVANPNLFFTSSAQTTAMPQPDVSTVNDNKVYGPQ